MSPVVIILIAIIAASVVGVLVLIGVRAAKLSRELDEAESKIDGLQGENRRLSGDLVAAMEANKKHLNWLQHQDQLVKSLEDDLEKRPRITRKTYRILTLGVKATGKTSLTLKWANPLIDLGMLEGTKIERYERTVSHVPQKEKDSVVEHVFEVHDWGGEHIVDALQELIVEEIHGLLIVVDLGGKDAAHPEAARIQAQLLEFQANALRFFFAPKMLSSCKTAVLFINKSDLIAGTPAHVEEEAKKLYAPLIDDLTKYSTQVDVRVLVGSASYGHSTHLLFSHFVERILPKNAYDGQLLQRMKSDFSATRVPGLSAPLLPAQGQATAPLTLKDDPFASIISSMNAPMAPGPAAGAAAGPPRGLPKTTLPMVNRPEGPPGPRRG